MRAKKNNRALPLLGCRGAVAGSQHFPNRRSEIVYAGARHDDRISAAVRLFGNTKKLPTIVFAELHMKAFPFNLELFRFDNTIHFRKNGAV